VLLALGLDAHARDIEQDSRLVQLPVAVVHLAGDLRLEVGQART
jgi:hypothetical protein